MPALHFCVLNAFCFEFCSQVFQLFDGRLENKAAAAASHEAKLNLPGELATGGI